MSELTSNERVSRNWDEPHEFTQAAEGFGKVEQCACGHMLEHNIHAIDLRPCGVEF